WSGLNPNRLSVHRHHRIKHGVYRRQCIPLGAAKRFVFRLHLYNHHVLHATVAKGIPGYSKSVKNKVEVGYAKAVLGPSAISPYPILEPVWLTASRTSLFADIAHQPIRVLAMAAFCGSISNPIHARPLALAAAGVVPPPTKGSQTRPSSGQSF